MKKKQTHKQLRTLSINYLNKGEVIFNCNKFCILCTSNYSNKISTDVYTISVIPPFYLKDMEGFKLYIATLFS